MKYLNGTIGAIHAQVTGFVQGVEIGAQQAYALGYQDASRQLIENGRRDNPAILGLIPIPNSVVEWWNGGAPQRTALLPAPVLDRARLEEVIDSATSSSFNGHGLRLTDGSGGEA